MNDPIGVERARGFTPAEISARVNAQVVDEHCEDAAQLWLQRSHAVTAPHYRFIDLAELDARVEANLAGVLLAGAQGLELARAWLSAGGPAELFVVTALAIARGDAAAFEQALELAADEALAPGFEGALAWLPFEWVAAFVRPLLDTRDPRLVRAGVVAHASARIDLGARLAGLALAEDRALRVRALRAIGELGRVDLVPLLEQVMQLAGDDDTQLAAIESWVRLAPASPAVQTKLWSFILAASDPTIARRAAWLSGRCLSQSSARSWYAKLLESPAHRHLAIELAGASGDPTHVDELITLTSTPALARGAGAALHMITGVDLAYLDLDCEAPEDFEAGPSDDPDDELVALDPEEDLPWPDPELVARWWAEQRGHFEPGPRWLGGKPIHPSTCWELLADAPQLLRRAAAFELARAQPNQPSFAVDAAAARQRRWLARHDMHGRPA